MKTSKAHWWVLLGIALGIVVGTVINQAHIEDVRQAVLGAEYSEADIHAHGKDNLDLALRQRLLKFLFCLPKTQNTLKEYSLICGDSKRMNLLDDIL